jgi:alkylation response protein AidB-like acyl-CoA dehydrogenase
MIAARDPLWLDRALGDPATSEGPMGLRSAVALDEREAYPDDAAAILDRLGLNRHYVPRSAGGELDSFEHLASLLRAVARRDLTLAVGHGKTVLGTQPVFLAGDAALQREVARRVLDGEPFALALTERAHGSDLLANETRADGRGLTGEKWLINNATRSTGLTVFARTSDRPGPRGFSLVFVDKRRSGGHFALLPKIKTHGIRGADISGIRFADAPVDHPPLGGEGAGLSATLKTFAITRTLIASVAVGAVDTALRIVFEFATDRTLYGGSLLRIPQARAVLASATGELLAFEAIALAGARLLHSSPEQAAFWSSVLKYFIPTAAERVVRELAVVFGARHYLREEAAFGAFQKVERDLSILSLFDGSTLVNLTNIAVHSRALARGRTATAPATALLDPLPEFDGRKLAVLGALVTGAESFATRALDEIERSPHATALRPALARLVARATATREHVTALAPAGPMNVTAALVEATSSYARYCALALACAVHAGSPGIGGALFRSGDWLVSFLASNSKELALSDALVESCQERLVTFAGAAVKGGNPVSLFFDEEGVA